MKKSMFMTAVAALLLGISACGHREASLEIRLPEKFEGKTVELISFIDSVPVAQGVVTGGKLSFGPDQLPDGEPVLTQMVIDGRVRAYYIVEPGMATLNDSTNVAVGTPLNERFAEMMASLDSVESLNDMKAYLDFAESRYNANRDNAMGEWFGIEWMKYASPASVDSMVSKASPAFAGSRRAKHYINFARLRAATAPGQKYIDFPGEDARGRRQNFSALVTPGQYTLVDFWASWCPYCIKELPELKQLYADWHDKGFEIVGVAVRDKAQDTAEAVERFEIPWKVLYNTERRPYDIYGFSGIPHHILIGPDGTIVSRDESAAQIAVRLQAIAEAENKGE